MVQKKYITVFGATGKIGKSLIEFLSGAAIPVIAVTRDLNKAIPLPFVEWRKAYMTEEKSLSGTMENSRAVFLLSGIGKDFVQAQCNVIRMAQLEQVGHLVKLSSAAVNENSPFFIPGSMIGQLHGAVEKFLKTSALGWTMLQPNAFMQNWLGELAHSVSTEGKIYEATGTGKRAYLDIRDVAEVVFQILKQPEKHAGQSYLLTGDEAINMEQLAVLISGETDKPVRFISLDEDQARKRMEEKGMPAVAVHSILSYAEAQRNNHADYVSGAVADILNKPARTVKAFVKEYASCFNRSGN